MIRNIVFYLLLACSFGLYATQTAFRECNCFNWEEPFVCTVAIRIGEDKDLYFLQPRERVTLRLNAKDKTEIHFIAYDQRGKEYRAERDGSIFNFHFNRECHTLFDHKLDYERLVIETKGKIGRCDFELFVPGNKNLNAVFRVEISLDGTLDRLTSQQARKLGTLLYEALLDRMPDETFDEVVMQLQIGKVDEVVKNITRSREFKDQVRKNSPAKRLKRYYKVLLERDPDYSAIASFLPKLRGGKDFEVIIAIIRSPEFIERLFE